ncbi:MAG: histidinol dehydrogenase [Actinomycetota bacterium]|jgi:histidinol dehydrogenase|nr:histidinol dehydrogenase [Actinomycetota bacterium]
MQRIDLRGRRGEDPRALLPRAELDVAAAVELVRPVVESVRDHGIAAVRDATQKYDGVSVVEPRVPVDVLAGALEQLDPAVRSALDEAASRLRTVCTAQLRDDVVVDVVDGATVTERWVPVGRVGLYVPGGLVAYPSSVVMNVVPAQVAGVGSLAVASPPQQDGRPHPAVMAACALLGIDEVYAVGGAQAIAMLAFGIEGCAAVDVITGPGNVYVAAAKRIVQGRVGIDSEAGPTEIGILADDTAEPAHVAADLVAQAEHDPLAACLLVTPSSDLLDRVDVELDKQVAATRHRERVETALAGQSAYVLVDDLEHGLEVVDAWAAEHLEVITADARERALRVRNAGAVFVGATTPVSLGDYVAGSNHVLPTGGTARFSSGLSAQSFLKRMSLIEYSPVALATAAPHVTALGGAEDLAAHVEAVQARVR